ncbi:rhomboid family intramembrane serine protease [Flammeovirga aprica]|uniref:Rhomboid family intramembrane serine protease n=1 Tax=Flammeovirga aprica JL-4 TaxID=694437 RepID=A0A7X9NYY8_9BACT|nr:rhomboid family intramembrane serine protease [Flammeovirga aprica]NME66489.1 rhomboid family intramembrane serine protease [Flammeovirga aprica JL-4]
MGQNLTPYVKILLIMNLVIFALPYLGSILPGLSPAYIDAFISDSLAYHHPWSEKFQIFQPITYMFVHSGFRHLFSNMFALFIFGPMLENVLGSKRFLTLYFLTGIFGGILFGAVEFYEVYNIEVLGAEYMMNQTPQNFFNFITNFPNYENMSLGYLANDFQQYFPTQDKVTLYDFAENIFFSSPDNANYKEIGAILVKNLHDIKLNMPMMGASGAIFGILFTFAYLFPNLKLMLLFPPIPIRAKYLVGAYILYETYELIAQNPADNVAHLAHLGGALFAYILMKRWRYQSYQ